MPPPKGTTPASRRGENKKKEGPPRKATEGLFRQVVSSWPRPRRHGWTDHEREQTSEVKLLIKPKKAAEMREQWQVVVKAEVTYTLTTRA